MLLPIFRDPGSEHITSTTVPELTGKCVVVSKVTVHSGLSPLQAEK